MAHRPACRQPARHRHSCGSGATRPSPGHAVPDQVLFVLDESPHDSTMVNKFGAAMHSPPLSLTSSALEFTSHSWVAVPALQAAISTSPLLACTRQSFVP